MQPFCWGPLRVGWVDRIIWTDFLCLDAMPIHPEQTLSLLIKIMGHQSETYKQHKKEGFSTVMIFLNWSPAVSYSSCCSPAAKTLKCWDSIRAKGIVRITNRSLGS